MGELLIYNPMPCFASFDDSSFACAASCKCRVECLVVTLFGEIAKIEELPPLLAHEDAFVRGWARRKFEELQGG